MRCWPPALVRPFGRTLPRRLLLGVAWTASTILTAYGAIQVVVGTLVLTDLIHPSGPVDRTALRWHVTVWDTWLLIWGILLAVATWNHHNQTTPAGSRPV